MAKRGLVGRRRRERERDGGLTSKHFHGAHASRAPVRRGLIQGPRQLSHDKNIRNCLSLFWKRGSQNWERPRLHKLNHLE